MYNSKTLKCVTLFMYLGALCIHYVQCTTNNYYIQIHHLKAKSNVGTINISY